MNFLAHLFFANPSDLSRIGNMLGDFAKGNREHLLAQFPIEVVEGIENHRRIDSFTDSHAAVKQAKGLLRKTHRHFSGIIVDVVFDHFLHHHWHQFSDQPVAAFIDECYRSFKTDIPGLPENYRWFIPILQQYDILNSYATLEGIDHALFRIGNRFKRPTTLNSAITDIEKHYPELELAFLTFFPRLIENFK